MSKDRDWEDYFQPNSSVLCNIPGLTRQEDLTLYESTMTLQRITELIRSPIQGKFDYEHMKAIHRYLFQDVYEWAGEERTAPKNAVMTKYGPDVVTGPSSSGWAQLRPYDYLPAGPGLTAAAEREYAALAQANWFRGLNQSDFSAALGSSWAKINIIHSFREGNTRSQFVFFRQLSQAAGYHLNMHAFAQGQPLREEFVNARFYAQATADPSRLSAVLAKAITPDRQQQLPEPLINQLRQHATPVQPRRAAPDQHHER